MSRKWTYEIGLGYESILRDGVMVNKEQAVRALKNYESRIAELKAFINQLIEAGKGLLDSLCTDPEEEKTVEVMNWKAVVDKVNKEREK